MQHTFAICSSSVSPFEGLEIHLALPKQMLLSALKAEDDYKHLLTSLI